MKRTKKSGFTLVELVVVIAIIGVLAAVVTPKVSMALTKSKDTKGVANLNTIRTASKMMFAETGKTLYSVDPYTANTTVPEAGKTLALKKEHLQALIDGKYLDNTASKLIENLAAGNALTMEVGTNMAGDNCTNGVLNGDATMENSPVMVAFDSDGVGVKLVSTDNTTATTDGNSIGAGVTMNGGANFVDTSCTIWSQK